MTQKATLLISEDEPDLREILVDELSELGCEILAAGDGEEALALLLDKKPHAVLTDLSMPKMNGIELTEKIRENGLLTPVVILTAFADKNNAVASLKLGAVDFLDKPYEQDVLQAAVKSALEMGLRLADIEKKMAGGKGTASLSESELATYERSVKSLNTVKKEKKAS